MFSVQFNGDNQQAIGDQYMKYGQEVVHDYTYTVLFVN